MKILNDESKFSTYNLYFYKEEEQKVISVKNWRKSYWFGDHAQAVQTCGKFITDRKTGKKIKIPTDYVMPYKWEPEILKLKERIENLYGVEFNSCLVGKFDSPKDKIGFHSDACENIGEDPYIGSVSFGKERNFMLKKHRKYCDNKFGESCTVSLGHGTLLVMRENANLKYLHAVPPDPNCSKDNYRINLTFRSYKYHQDEMAFVPK